MLVMKRTPSQKKGRPSSLNRLGPYDGDDLLVVIETPKGSQNKLAFNRDSVRSYSKASCQREQFFHSILVSSRRPLATMATHLMCSF